MKPIDAVNATPELTKTTANNTAQVQPQQNNNQRQPQATPQNQPEQSQAGLDFIRQIVADDLSTGKTQQVVTRFPPEPNGYLHIGHVKAICLNFSIANENNGLCNLRFDDTNPEAEEQEYVDNIEKDIHWLGFEWNGAPRYASSYFHQLYDWAVQLIKQGDAYVDLQSAEQIKLNRGSFVELGKNSPHRDQSVEDNLALFEKMRAGGFDEGQAVLRAKIDMASPNVHMRDPILYRVLKAEHHQTGNEWVIYPMYDYAHPLSDAIEGITHSLCTLEFVDHRPFYDWVVAKVHSQAVPRQYESSRLNIDYTLTSKRKLRRLVEGGFVSGWDDPRMPTVAGMRRRGFTPEGLRDFCARVGVSKTDGVVDVGLLEFCIRQSLENTAARAMAVLNPLKVTLTNLPETVVSTHKRHPNVDMGERDIPITQTIYIDKNDFAEIPPKGFKRLVADGEVRLRHAYVIKCDEVIKDAAGEVIELKCSIDPDTLGKNPEGRKVKGVIHWVSADQGVPAEVRIYDRLFSEADPETGDDFLANLNPDSLKIVQAVVEPALATAQAGERFQFEREGYFIADEKDHSADKLVFNRILDLKDSFKPS
jgi:glutaminyl-tRNA synthetase